VNKQLRETHPLLATGTNHSCLQYSRFEKAEEKEDVLLEVKEQFSIPVNTTTGDCNSRVMISTPAHHVSQTPVVAEQE